MPAAGTAMETQTDAAQTATQGSQAKADTADGSIQTSQSLQARRTGGAADAGAPRLNHHVFYTSCKPEKFEEYVNFHDNIWPEVAHGLLNVAGVRHLNIYHVPGTPGTLCMVIETDPQIAPKWLLEEIKAGKNAGQPDAIADGENAKGLDSITGPDSEYMKDATAKKWEDFMCADFHGGWTECVRVHSSAREWVKALEKKA